MTSSLFTNVGLPHQGLRIMCEVLAEHEIDPTALLLRAGIDPGASDDPLSLLNGHQEVRLQRLFQQATSHIPGIGYRTGQRYRVMADGPLGLAAMTSSNITDALRLLDELQELGCGLHQFSVVERGGSATAISAETWSASADMQEFLHERFLGAAPSFLRDLRHEALPIDRIESILDRPKHWLNLDAALDAEVVFGAAQTTIHLGPGAGDLPLPMANASLADHYRRVCVSMIDAIARRNTIVHAIYQLLLQREASFPTASEAALHLNLSERSLHRKLASQGASYQAILDNVRLRRARELLDEPGLSIAEISECLGFAEMASFSRFFRRVAGTPPLAYRRIMQGLVNPVH